MMESLLRLDVELFRMIHVGLRRDWLDMLTRVFSDSGLSHAQLTALAAVGMRRRVHWGWVLAFSLAVVIGSAGYEGWKYGKPPTIALSYLMCLGLFWLLPSRTAWWAAGAGALTGIARLALVKPIARPRPSNLPFAHPMEPIYGATSFPSGHTTTSFAIAAFIFWATARREDSWLGIAALVWAALVGFSRIYVGVHYPADVLAGAALGVMGGTAAWMAACRWGGFTEAPDPLSEPGPSS